MTNSSQSYPSLRTSTDLLNHRNSIRKQMTAHTRIQVGMGTCGIAAGAGKIFDFFQELLRTNALEIDLVPVGCMGECAFEPMVEIVETDGTSTIYCKVTKTMVEEIVISHLQDGKPLDKYSLSRWKK